MEMNIEQEEQDNEEKLQTQTKTNFDIWHNLPGQGESFQTGQDTGNCRHGVQGKQFKTAGNLFSKCQFQLMEASSWLDKGNQGPAMSEKKLDVSEQKVIPALMLTMTIAFERLDFISFWFITLTGC